MVFMAKQAGKPTRVTHKTAYLWIKRKLQAKNTTIKSGFMDIISQFSIYNK